VKRVRKVAAWWGSVDPSLYASEFGRPSPAVVRALAKLVRKRHPAPPDRRHPMGNRASRRGGPVSP
jgi:hypothetical protein